MGQPGVDPRGAVGQYIEPEDWNDFISAEDVVVIDPETTMRCRLARLMVQSIPRQRVFVSFHLGGKTISSALQTRRLRCSAQVAFDAKNLRVIYEAKGLKKCFTLKVGY